jgi:hypothetical protein
MSIQIKEIKKFKTYELLGHFASFSIEDKKSLMSAKSPITLKLYMLFQIELAVKHKSIQHHYIDNLAKETNSSKKTILRSLDELKNLNIIFFENFGVRGIGIVIKNNETLSLIEKLKSEEFTFMLNQNLSIIPKIEIPSLDTHVQLKDTDVQELDKYVQLKDINVQKVDTYVQVNHHQSRINTNVEMSLKNIYKNNILESDQDHQKEESQNQISNSQIEAASEQRKFDDDEIKKDFKESDKDISSLLNLVEEKKLDVIDDDDKKNDLRDKEISPAPGPASESLLNQENKENQDDKIKLLAERISEEIEGMSINLSLSLVKANGYDFVLYTYEKFLGLLEIDENGDSKIRNQVAYFRKMLSNFDTKKEFEENQKAANFEQKQIQEKDEFETYRELAKFLKLATSINKNLIYDDIATQILKSCYLAFFDEKVMSYDIQKDFVVKLITMKNLISFQDLFKLINKFMQSSGQQYKKTFSQDKVSEKIKELWSKI